MVGAAKADGEMAGSVAAKPTMRWPTREMADGEMADGETAGGEMTNGRAARWPVSHLRGHGCATYNSINQNFLHFRVVRNAKVDVLNPFRS